MEILSKKFTESPDCTPIFIDLSNTPISITDGFLVPEDKERVFQSILSCDVVILGTPEYDGSFSGAIKLFIEQLGYPSILRDKAVAIVGVATGSIGAIKAIEHLKGVCSHVGAVILPYSISIARVHEVFGKGDSSTQFQDADRALAKLAANIVSYQDKQR